MIDLVKNEGGDEGSPQASLARQAELAAVIGDLEKAIEQLDSLDQYVAAARVSHGLETARRALDSLRNGANSRKINENESAK